MSESERYPELGQVVQILQGREAGQFAIVIKKLDSRFVLLADGDKRKYDRPKKKNVQHIAPANFTSPEVQKSLLETGRVTNGKLRYAINKFVTEFLTDLKKGDQLDGERRCN
ncbi:RNA-binding protein [Gracilibacillus oryzae]|uniref:RNA-binding protein n=1 Tax=Gracilibacillus oryzae TaxID=1672701 RepID=A0A7C8GRL4_9BACI|nr:KOW domain-containing RNA-binding protein [Gracilibacillus oryzae]KAB8127650.1 RNA-binding protein [Gracilibacillus oryzae]